MAAGKDATRLYSGKSAHKIRIALEKKPASSVTAAAQACDFASDRSPKGQSKNNYEQEKLGAGLAVRKLAFRETKPILLAAI
jgi:hypothetical protein